MMKPWCRPLCAGVLVWGFAWLIGCAPIEPLPPTPSTPVMLTSFTNVAGKWSGVLKTIPPMRENDWVTLTIRNDGSYEFVSVRTIGIFRGTGTFALVEGTLRAETERGQAVVTLYEEGTRRRLSVDGSTKDGMRYAAELSPAK